MGKSPLYLISLQSLAMTALLLLAAPTILAQAPTSSPPASQPSAPQPTYVGIYVNEVYDLDLKRSTYVVDFYIWFRWQGNYDPSEFEFMNGTLDLKEHPYKLISAGVNYLSYHCRGTFHNVFNYRRYPLDEHPLILEMEDNPYESSQLRYVVDSENMRNLRTVTLTGWNCSEPRFEVHDHVYNTTFGDLTEKAGGTSTFSRLYCSMLITRSGDSIYVKTFLGLFISVGIAFLSFLFKPGDTDPRFAVGVAAIFGAVSSEIVATSNLPDMPYLTLADKIHLFSLFMIFLSLLQSCLSLRLARQESHAIAIRLDRISLFAFPIAYAIVVSLLTLIY